MKAGLFLFACKTIYYAGGCTTIFATFRFVRRETSGNAFDENGDMTSPELSLVLEKAVVLLNGNEFSALRRILAEYEAAEINVDTFAENLLRLITDKEKVIIVRRSSRSSSLGWANFWKFLGQVLSSKGWVSRSSLVCFWFWCKCYQIVHFTTKTRPQPPNFKRFVRL